MDRNPSSPRPLDGILSTTFAVGCDERVDLVSGIHDLLVASVIPLRDVEPGRHSAEIWPEDQGLHAAAPSRRFCPGVWTIGAAAHHNAFCRQGTDKPLDCLAIQSRA